MVIIDLVALKRLQVEVGVGALQAKVTLILAAAVEVLYHEDLRELILEVVVTVVVMVLVVLGGTLPDQVIIAV